MTLSSKRIHMRAPEPSDLDFLYLLENSDGAEGSGFTAAPVSRRMLHDYIEAYSADINTDGQLRLVIEDTATGQAIGTADISDYDSRDRRGFVGIIIADSHRRQGYGKEALQLLCDYAATTLACTSLPQSSKSTTKPPKPSSPPADSGRPDVSAHGSDEDALTPTPYSSSACLPEQLIQ